MTTINLVNLTISNSKKQENEIDCSFDETRFVETLKEIKSGKAFERAKPIDELFDKVGVNRELN